jgi:DNA polymerase-1
MQAQVGWKKAFSLSLYATKLASSIEADGRVYCNFRQYGAGTGRMTSSQPINLQNIPRDGRFRDAFEAPAGWKFIVGDYPTVEPRLIAEVANDKVMLESFRQGRDIYKTTAAALNNIDYDDVTPAQRKQAKPILLGLQYGMGAEKLGRYSFLNYNVTLADPKETRDKFFSLYKGLRAWHRKIADAVETATDYEARTPSGRRRSMSAATKSFSAAVNAPIQGGAADIMKRALVLLPQMILEAGLEETQLVSVVHDETLLLAPDHEAEAAAAVLKAAMEAGAAEFLKIPLSVDVGIGQSWGSAKV